MRSLRVRIAIAVITVAVSAIGALAVGLYAQVSRRIRADFDRRLLEDGRVLAELIEWEPHDGLELELDPMLASFDRQRAARTWFRLWDAEGVMRTGNAPDWIGGPTERTEPTFENLAVDGTTIRVVRWSFHARVDEDAAERDHDRAPRLSLSLARDTVEVEEMLGDLAGLFWMLGTCTALLVGGAAAWQVTRGLRPVRHLAAEIDARGPGELAKPLPTADLPQELVPIVRRFNALLDRVRAALEREREFSGHVAHELRTPLSVMRTGLELALRRLPTDAGGRRHLDDAVDTIDEMAGMVDNLLMLARVERDDEAVAELEPVALAELVDEVWRTFAARADARGLSFRNEIAPDRTIDATNEELRIVLQNLLGNAVSYTEDGGHIVASSAGETLLSVWDSGPPLPAADLPRVFDRLWRADRARTDATQHAGLGLSLARALCRHMRMDIAAENTADGGLRFSVTARARPEPVS